MNNNLLKLRDLIKEKGRLLNEEELVDFYAENIMQIGYCRIYYTSDVVEGEIRYKRNSHKVSYWQIKTNAQAYLIRALGMMVKSGIIKTDLFGAP